MRQDIVTALEYFRYKTSATAVFIYLQEGVAYVIEGNDETIYGFMPTSELEEFIGQLGVHHQIQIITQCDHEGNYVLPDIKLLEFEKEIDY